MKLIVKYINTETEELNKEFDSYSALGEWVADNISEISILDILKS